jgi:hypothetical protein
MATKVKLKRKRATMRSKGQPDSGLSTPLSYPDAVDMRNVIVGAAVKYKLDSWGDRRDLHEEFKYTARSHYGWIETGGEHGNDPATVYSECCATLRKMFGL